MQLHLQHRDVEIRALKSSAEDSAHRDGVSVLVAGHCSIHDSQPRARAGAAAVLERYRATGLRGLCDVVSGEFALAVLDGRQVHLIADPLGGESLYFTVVEHAQGGHAAVASNDMFVVATDGASVRGSAFPVDRDVARAFLWNDLAGRLEPHRTLLAGVHRVPSGHAATIDMDTGAWSLRRYWQPGRPYLQVTVAQMFERIDAALTDAVAEVMSYPGKVAIALSGGIDSGLIAALAARIDPARVLCFTMSYGDDARTNEIPEATRIAESLGLPIHVVDTSASHAFRDVEPAAAFRHGIPMQTLGWSQNALVTEAVRRGASVVLAGYGSEVTLAPTHSPAYLVDLVCAGDLKRAVSDLFAWTGALGYGPIHVARMALDRMALDRPGKHDEVGAQRGDGPAFLRVPDELARAAYTDPSAQTQRAHRQLARFLALKPLIAEDWQLRRSVFDRHPVKVMSPFMSRTLVDLCFALPPWMLHNPREHKWLMKEYARRKFPDLRFRFNADYFAPDYIGLRRERERLDNYFDDACRLLAHDIATPEILPYMRAFLVDPAYFDYEIGNQSVAPLRQALFLEMWLRGYEEAA